ncbi:hypothetical protein AB4059_04185 [Lysobacter sp. 2RAF19]
MITRESIIISVVRGLWGEITPELRAVVCIRRGPDAFDIVFYVDGEPSDALLDAASSATGEALGDYPDTAEIEERIERVDVPERIPLNEDSILIFLRKEADVAGG